MGDSDRRENAMASWENDLSREEDMFEYAASVDQSVILRCGRSVLFFVVLFYFAPSISLLSYGLSFR